MGFFDNYERFYSTSETTPIPQRLNARHTAIFERNLDAFAGMRVLDIASHDGRWTLAAIKAGAAHVVGIEPRRELVDNAVLTLSEYGIDPGMFDLQIGDIFDTIRGQRFDVVLCLGFYYHTIRHAQLLDLIERTGAGFVIIDTEVTPLIEEKPVLPSGDPRLVYRNPNEIQILIDPVEDQRMAWTDSLTRNGRTIVGRPSRAAIAFLAGHFGYHVEMFDWPDYFAVHPEAVPSMADYADRWRETFYLSKP